MIKRSYLFDNPRNVRRMIRLLIFSCVLLFILDFILHRHVEHPWEAFTGFYAIYGFTACVILVLLARELRKLVMRKENYYRKSIWRRRSGDRKKGVDCG